MPFSDLRKSTSPNTSPSAGNSSGPSSDTRPQWPFPTHLIRPSGPLPTPTLEDMMTELGEAKW
jgi:hypothetical protein